MIDKIRRSIIGYGAFSIGSPAYLTLQDGRNIMTSNVVSYTLDVNGNIVSIETKNTIYVNVFAGKKDKFFQFINMNTLLIGHSCIIVDSEGLIQQTSPIEATRYNPYTGGFEFATKNTVYHQMYR